MVDRFVKRYKKDRILISSEARYFKGPLEICHIYIRAISLYITRLLKITLCIIRIPAKVS